MPLVGGSMRLMGGRVYRRLCLRGWVGLVWLVRGRVTLRGGWARFRGCVAGGDVCGGDVRGRFGRDSGVFVHELLFALLAGAERVVEGHGLGDRLYMGFSWEVTLDVADNWSRARVVPCKKKSSWYCCVVAAEGHEGMHLCSMRGEYAPTS